MGNRRNALVRIIKSTGVGAGYAFYPDESTSMASSSSRMLSERCWENPSVDRRETLVVCEISNMGALGFYPRSPEMICISVTPATIGKHFPMSCVVGLATSTQRLDDIATRDVVIQETALVPDDANVVGARGEVGMCRIQIPVRTLYRIASVISVEPISAYTRLFLSLRFLGCTDGSRVHRIAAVRLYYDLPDCSPCNGSALDVEETAQDREMRDGDVDVCINMSVSLPSEASTRVICLDESTDLAARPLGKSHPSSVSSSFCISETSPPSRRSGTLPRCCVLQLSVDEDEIGMKGAGETNYEEMAPTTSPKPRRAVQLSIASDDALEGYQESALITGGGPRYARSTLEDINVQKSSWARCHSFPLSSHGMERRRKRVIRAPVVDVGATDETGRQGEPVRHNHRNVCIPPVHLFTALPQKDIYAATSLDATNDVGENNDRDVSHAGEPFEKKGEPLIQCGVQALSKCFPSSLEAQDVVQQAADMLGMNTAQVWRTASRSSSRSSSVRVGSCMPQSPTNTLEVVQPLSRSSRSSGDGGGTCPLQGSGQSSDLPFFHSGSLCSVRPSAASRPALGATVAPYSSQATTVITPGATTVVRDDLTKPRNQNRSVRFMSQDGVDISESGRPRRNSRSPFVPLLRQTPGSSSSTTWLSDMNTTVEHQRGTQCCRSVLQDTTNQLSLQCRGNEKKGRILTVPTAGGKATGQVEVDDEIDRPVRDRLCDEPNETPKHHRVVIPTHWPGFSDDGEMRTRHEAHEPFLSDGIHYRRAKHEPWAAGDISSNDRQTTTTSISAFQRGIVSTRQSPDLQAEVLASSPGTLVATAAAPSSLNNVSQTSDTQSQPPYSRSVTHSVGSATVHREGDPQLSLPDNSLRQHHSQVTIRPVNTPSSAAFLVRKHHVSRRGTGKRILGLSRNPISGSNIYSAIHVTLKKADHIMPIGKNEGAKCVPTNASLPTATKHSYAKGVCDLLLLPGDVVEVWTGSRAYHSGVIHTSKVHSQDCCFVMFCNGQLVTAVEMQAVTDIQLAQTILSSQARAP